MSRIYQSLKNKQSDRNASQPSKQTVDSSERPAKTAQLTSSSRSRKAPATPTSLFRADPEENIKLWMEKYFPGTSITREEAIRQWLARPAEFRVQSILESPANRDESTVPETSEPAALETANDKAGASGQGADENPRSHWERASQPILTGAVSVPTDRSRKINKLVFRLVVCSVLAFVIIKLLWAIPETHLFSRADSSIPESKARTIEATASPTVPVASHGDEAATRSEIATGPSRIEKLSIGCSDAQPCLEIDTLGKETLPALSTLTNPDRLVIDFQDAAYSADIHRIHVRRGPLKAVRISGNGNAQSPSARVVLDLTMSCDYELQTLTNKLVVNLYPKTTPRRTE